MRKFKNFVPKFTQSAPAHTRRMLHTDARAELRILGFVLIARQRDLNDECSFTPHLGVFTLGDVPSFLG